MKQCVMNIESRRASWESDGIGMRVEFWVGPSMEFQCYGIAVGPMAVGSVRYPRNVRPFQAVTSVCMLGSAPMSLSAPGREAASERACVHACVHALP